MAENVKELRCKASTDSFKLAGSIYSAIKDNEESCTYIKVIGAGALNQAIKGVIISNRYFAKKGMIAKVYPSFQDVDGNMTAISLKVIPEKL